MKNVVRWLIVSLTMSGTAWAQENPSGQAQVEKMCRTATYPISEWAMCAPYRPVKTTRDAHPKLEATGWLMMIVGGLWMIPIGDTISVFGDNYCVTDYSVDEGGCSTPHWKMKLALATVGTGFVFTRIGGRQVAINPVVQSQVKGVTATVRWGGKRPAR